jgi:hypothetical protein
VHSLALRIVVVLIAAAVVTTPAHGQRSRMAARRGAPASAGPEIGGHVGYNFDIKHTLVGAQASFPITPRLEFYPSFDWYTGGSATEWGLNFDLKLRPPAVYQFWYGGAGLNLHHTSTATSTTTSHLNLFAGFAGRPGTFRPYAEGRLTLGAGSAFQLAGGLSFPLR